MWEHRWAGFLCKPAKWRGGQKAEGQLCDGPHPSKSSASRHKAEVPSSHHVQVISLSCYEIANNRKGQKFEQLLQKLVTVDHIDKHIFQVYLILPQRVELAYIESMVKQVLALNPVSAEDFLPSSIHYLDQFTSLMMHCTFEYCEADRLKLTIVSQISSLIFWQGHLKRVGSSWI